MIYLHGLVLGVGLTVFGLAHMWMTTALGVGMELGFQARFLQSMFAISPCVSGFLVATAVGRPFVGAISFLSAVVILLSGIIRFVRFLPRPRREADGPPREASHG